MITSLGLPEAELTYGPDIAWIHTTVIDEDNVKAEDIEHVYPGMTKIKISFLNVEKFEEFSDDMVHSGAAPERAIADVKLIDNVDNTWSIFGVELFRIEETANYSVMDITLFGYWREPRDDN